MDSEWIIRIVIFGIIHWILAGFFLNDIASRQKVFGRRKAPWVVIILLVPCFGSILYLLFHPQIFSPN
jgi:hypothetical protein